MRFSLTFFAMLLLAFSSNALLGQTTILDFETPETTTPFLYFENNDLSGQPTMVIANPNPTGDNTSANVAEFIKTPNAATFAGAGTDPNPATPVDLSVNTIVCIDVHMPNEGNLRLKLEQGVDGAGDWELQLPNTVVNNWEQLCFNTALPSANGSGVVAAGSTYEKIVLFFDFDEVLTEAETYYFDNIITQAPPTVDVTFSVDMNDYTGDAFNEVFVNGTFNAWNGTSNPMTDDDGDGIWTATYPITAGPLEYKFTLDGWTFQEEFSPGGECTITTNGFTNRFVTLADDITLPTVCWNSCYACGEGVNITWNVGTSHISASADGIFLTGGGNFGVPGDFPMTDEDMDGVFTITLERQRGFASFYAFANGNCPDFSCKEDLAGQDCADPNNFNDRFLPAVSQDTVINTCYGLCTTDLECGGELEMVAITINVGTSEIEVAPEGIYLAGGASFGAPGENPLTDDDGDGVWSITVMRPAGFSGFWTLANGNCPDFSCKEDIAGQSCANPGNFNDRFMGPISADTTINTCFAQCTTTTTCEMAPELRMVTFRIDMNLYSGPASIESVFVAGSFQGWNNEANLLADDDMDGVWETTIMIPDGTHEYKFGINSDWDLDEDLEPGSECTITTGEFTNRIFTLDGEDVVLPTFCFGECVTCDMVNTTELLAKGIEFNVRPTITTGEILLDFGNQPLPLSNLSIVTPQGQVLKQWTLDGTYQELLNIGELPAGLYFLTLEHQGARGVQRVIKQ